MTFETLGLSQPVLQALELKGYDTPTPIQTQSIPHLLEGRDLLGIAQTGTGKTAAFALPLLNRLADGDRPKAPIGLVLVPTRELAMQVSQAVHVYGRPLGARVVPIYGGQPIVRQLTGAWGAGSTLAGACGAGATPRTRSRSAWPRRPRSGRGPRSWACTS